LEEFKTTKLPYWLEKYEGFLKQNGGQFLVGSALTWADIALFEYLQIDQRFTSALNKIRKGPIFAVLCKTYILFLRKNSVQENNAQKLLILLEA